MKEACECLDAELEHRSFSQEAATIKDSSDSHGILMDLEQNIISSAWIVKCASKKDNDKALQVVHRECNLDNVITDILIGCSNEVYKTELHRIGDYFDNIQIVLNSPDSGSFGLVFQPKIDAKRYWKDIVVKILNSIETSAPNVSVLFFSKKFNSFCIDVCC